jgi:hypothetical protein
MILSYCLNLLAIALLCAVAMLLISNPANDTRATRLGRVADHLRRGGAGLWAFLVRTQEHAGWAPMCAAAALLAWVVLGALDRTASVDLLASLGQAPIRALYAFLAMGSTYVVVKRTRRKLDDEAQRTFWNRLTTASWRDGPVIVYLVERIFTLVALALFLHFFRVAA